MVALVGLRAACTPGADVRGPVAPALPAGGEVSADQAAALADGEVTYDEYAAGFRRFVSCMSAAGHEVVSISEKNQIIDYSITDAAVQDGSDDRCYLSEFGQLDGTWQVVNEDRGETADYVRACLRSAGIEPVDTLDGMLEQLETNGIDFAACDG